MKRSIALLLVGAVFAASAPQAKADLVYNFDQFTPLGVTTPLPSANPLDFAPPDNSPGDTLGARFTSAPTGTAFVIQNVTNNFIDPPFAGQYLAQPDGDNPTTGNALTVTFNQTVTSVSFDFAGTDPMDISVVINGDSGNTQTASALVAGMGSEYPYVGSFSYSGSIDSITIRGTATQTETQIAFGIDNLTVPGDPIPPDTGVPEPATLAVFGVLSLGAFGARRRVKATA